MEVNYLSSRVKLLWMLPAILIVLFIWMISIVTYSLFNEYGTTPLFIALILSLVILIPYLIYVTLSYNNFYYQFGETELSIRRGIIGKRVDVVPYSKIQHIRTERTMLEHVIGLVHIHIETAGSIHSEDQPKIPGIPLDDHESIIELLQKKADESHKTHHSNAEPEHGSDKILKEVLYELKAMNTKLDSLKEKPRTTPVLSEQERKLMFEHHKKI